jgi:hypothetical protein
MECEINCKVEDIGGLNQEIKVLTNDLEERLQNKNSGIHRQVRELQHRIKEYDKKEEDPKRSNAGDRQTSQRPQLTRELRLTEGYFLSVHNPLLKLCRQFRFRVLIWLPFLITNTNILKQMFSC